MRLTHPSRLVFSRIRCFSASRPPLRASNPVRKDIDAVDEEDEDVKKAKGKKHIRFIFEERSSTNIRAMLLAAGVNISYWGLNTAWTVLENISSTPSDSDFDITPFSLLSGAELYSAFFLASLGLLGATKLYASHAVMRCYENLRDERVGFQVHTIFGRPGLIMEVPIGNTSIEDGGRGGMVGIRVEGLMRPLIMPNSEAFRDCEELHEILQRKKKNENLAKQERIGWRKRSFRGPRTIKL